MGWFAYSIAWLAAALFWTLASSTSARVSPLVAFPWGLLAMGVAGVMGVAVWRLTDHVPWDWRARRFYLTHALALVVYTGVYATSWSWPDLLAGRFAAAYQAFRTSPIIVWNLLMGSWLYLVVAGLSYAVRAHRRIRMQEAAAAEARLLAQQAQLAALRAQINPHFLFNALHSVGALVSSDPARADRALECLGDLLRYALGAEDRVLFAQEWRFTQDYLAFEQLRLGNRLRVDAHVETDAQSVLVPPLLLQPLVENAVRHGIADRPDGGRVEIRARVEGARLLVRVTDDGNGSPAGVDDGLGLGSVRRRLAALYGDEASLAIEPRTAGFSVEIALPTTTADDLGSAA
jgi:sensor histidine kinase YesM